MRAIIIGLAGAALSLAAGFLAAAESEPLRDSYRQVRSQVRTGLGLPKAWFSVPDAAAIGTRTARPCPSPADAIVLVVGGQSNAANSLSTRYTAGDAVSVWFEGKCYPAEDPLLGADGTDGSLWSHLGDALAEQTGRPVMLIVGAIGGTQFSDWNDARSGYYAALKQRIGSASKAGFEPDLILWHQGETDAATVRDTGVLRSDMERLHQTLLRDAPEAKLYLFQTSRCNDARRISGVPTVIAVFREVAEANPRIVLGLNTDTLGKEYRWDQCHFNIAGREAIVKSSVPQIIPLL